MAIFSLSFTDENFCITQNGSSSARAMFGEHVQCAQQQHAVPSGPLKLPTAQRSRLRGGGASGAIVTTVRLKVNAVPCQGLTKPVQ